MRGFDGGYEGRGVTLLAEDEVDRGSQDGDGGAGLLGDRHGSPVRLASWLSVKENGKGRANRGLGVLSAAFVGDVGEETDGGRHGRHCTRREMALRNGRKAGRN